MMIAMRRPPDFERLGDAEGWYHTGDLASLDGRGYLRIQGRIKDMIIRGGENIYPREIEDVLFDHPPSPRRSSSASRTPNGVRWWPPMYARSPASPHRPRRSCGRTAGSGWRYKTPCTGYSLTPSR